VCRQVQKREGTRLIVFVVGGVTYSEIRVVYEVSKAKNRDIIIGNSQALSLKIHTTSYSLL
jgi:syntaxin-binding protein 1